MNDIYWILLAVITSSLPILFAKEYIKTKNVNLIIFAIISYLTLLFTYINLFEQNEISKIYSLIKISQLIVVAIVAIYIHNEKINRNKIIGLGAGIISIIYLGNS